MENTASSNETDVDVRRVIPYSLCMMPKKCAYSEKGGDTITEVIIPGTHIGIYCDQSYVEHASLACAQYCDAFKICPIDDNVREVFGTYFSQQFVIPSESCEEGGLAELAKGGFTARLFSDGLAIPVQQGQEIEHQFTCSWVTLDGLCEKNDVSEDGKRDIIASLDGAIDRRYGVVVPHKSV